MASNVFRPLPVQVSLEKPRSPRPLFAIFSSQAIASPLFSSRKPLRSSGVFALSRTQEQEPSSSSSAGPSPPASREEAVRQAKTCLSTTLQKPLNNIVPLPSKKLKRQKQPKFRVEIPVADGSPDSLAQLAFEVFSELPIKRKGARPAILMVWPDSETAERGRRAFAASDESRGPAFENLALGNVSSGDWSSADMGVFVASEAAMVERVRSLSDCLYPKPVVLFNPNWGFEEENSFDPAMGAFAGSFEVVYSFIGLEAKGLLSKRNAVVFRCVKDGIFSGEAWTVLVEDETNKGELKVVTRFRKRPSMAEVENVLYNLMAANSPVTKSVKFLKDLVSNVTGGRGGK
ncbi:unnamed protein product [Spirodela intermedia]|uniref:DUF1995 domain-containing protein n=1 Tax=Spirodela intermedia TaxID=51605 RepID=A0A7I8KAG0_SPIIN|nr:unnamed protein product [Spirodela intermedia]